MTCSTFVLQGFGKGVVPIMAKKTTPLFVDRPSHMALQVILIWNMLVRRTDVCPLVL